MLCGVKCSLNNVTKVTGVVEYGTIQIYLKQHERVSFLHQGSLRHQQ